MKLFIKVGVWRYEVDEIDEIDEIKLSWCFKKKISALLPYYYFSNPGNRGRQR